MPSPAPRPWRARRRPPLVVESMERRELMAAKVHPAAVAKPQQPILVASLGDSLTDEYTFNGPATLAAQSAADTVTNYPANITTLNQGSARNWVSGLAALRGGQVSFGQFGTANRGGTRLQGFSQDWARSGAAAVGTDLMGGGTTFASQYSGVPSMALPGMLTQTANATGDVDPKAIKVVTIFIGTNDYRLGVASYAQTNGQYDVFTPSQSLTSPVNAGIEDAITAAIGKIRTTIPDAKIVVVTPQNLMNTPLFTQFYKSIPGLADKVTQSLTGLNDDVARIAKKQKLGYVSLQAMGTQMGVTPTVAGQAINLQGSGPDLDDAFVGDGFHFGTVMQGKIGQAIVKQINVLYGKNVISPIADPDIIQYARATQTSVAATATRSATDPTKATVTATVAPGVGNGSNPTGTVTFEAIVPGTITIPTQFGTVLGVVPVDATGHATLDVDAGVLNSATFYAVYGGDELHDSRVSNGLAPFTSFA